MQIDLAGFDYTAFVNQLASWGINELQADRVWRGVYLDLVDEWDQVDGVDKAAVRRLEERAVLGRLNEYFDRESEDGLTRKFLLGSHKEDAVETVIMRFKSRRDRPLESERYTACVSTQVGCAMGCVFCATGQMGFSRHLSSGEIVGQVLFVQRELKARQAKLRNVVLMGMGEPLHNFENVRCALEILVHPKGLGLAPRHITLSTVGIPNGIRRLAELSIPINLAVSLHGATDAARQALVPVANRWGLSEVLDACRYYVATRKRKIFFEWTLIDDKNDTPEQAEALGKLLNGLHGHVNLIPLNSTEGYCGTPSRLNRIKHFQSLLANHGVPSTVRQRRGIDIAAGCGQLRRVYNPQ